MFMILTRNGLTRAQMILDSNEITDEVKLKELKIIVDRMFLEFLNLEQQRLRGTL